MNSYFKENFAKGASTSENTKEYMNKMKAKKNIVVSQFLDLDEKDYIPIKDFFYMLENPNMLFTPKPFIELAKQYPKEYIEYISDDSPLDPYCF